MFGTLTPLFCARTPLCTQVRPKRVLLPSKGPRTDLRTDEATDVAKRAEDEQQHFDPKLRRAAGTDPAKWFWLGRALGSVLITVILRMAAGPDFAHLGGETHGSENHAAPAASVEKQLARLTIHRDGNLWRMQWILLIMMGLMGATVLFEMFRDWLEEVLANYRMVVDKIWSELTVLGFLALCTFVMIQGGVLPAISTFAFGDHHHLVHLFEVLHFMLFFILLGFLFLVLWLLFALAHIEKEHKSFETGLAFYRGVAGTRGRTMKSALGLEGKIDPEATNLELSTGAEMVESALLTLNSEVHQRSYFGKLRGYMDPCDSAAWELLHAQRLVAYQRLRHRFIMSPASFGRESLPADFDFSDYLLKCVQHQLADIITLGPDVWLCWMAFGVIICEVGALATELEEKYGRSGLAQGLLISAGWVLFIQACLVEQHYTWVSEQLSPVQSVESAQAEVARMRARGLFWRPLYDWLHTCMEPAEICEAPTSLPKPWKGIDILNGIKSIAVNGGKGIVSIALDGGKGIAKTINGGVSKIGETNLARRSTRVSYEPGEYMRSGFSLKAGESKHTSLFKLKESIKSPESIDLTQMKLAVERPAQRWVRQMLLASSLLIAINCVFCQPEGVWDWKIPLGTFPLVLMMAFQVPNTLEKLVVSLSVEMFTDVKRVQDVLYASKLRRFAQSSKLLQALRSQARMETKGEQKNKPAPKNLEELVSMVPIEKQLALTHLKETFDLFNTDQDSTLQPHELCAMLLATGTNVSTAEVDRMIEDMDGDNDGQVTFVEFAWYSLSRNDMTPRKAAETVFEAIDTDGSGVLSVNEIRTAFKNLRSGLDEDELMDIISIFDVGSTGRVEKSEFVDKLEEIYKENF